MNEVLTHATIHLFPRIDSGLDSSNSHIIKIFIQWINFSEFRFPPRLIFLPIPFVRCGMSEIYIRLEATRFSNHIFELKCNRLNYLPRKTKWQIVKTHYITRNVTSSNNTRNARTFFFFFTCRAKSPIPTCHETPCKPHEIFIALLDSFLTP